MGKHVVASVMLSLAVAGIPAVTAAAPKTGCPAGASGAELMTVAAAADLIFDKLLDNPFDSAADLVPVLESYNRNGDTGDDSVCVFTRWGERLNENSHWYKLGFEVLGDEPATLLIVVDNNANAQK